MKIPMLSVEQISRSIVGMCGQSADLKSVRAGFEYSAKTMRDYAQKARATGKKHRGYTEEEATELAIEHEARAISVTAEVARLLGRKA